jgi:hypothetical protein
MFVFLSICVPNVFSKVILMFVFLSICVPNVFSKVILMFVLFSNKNNFFEYEYNVFCFIDKY